MSRLRPRRGRTCAVRIGKTTHKKLREVARSEEVTIRSVIERLIRKGAKVEGFIPEFWGK